MLYNFWYWFLYVDISLYSFVLKIMYVNYILWIEFDVGMFKFWFEIFESLMELGEDL